MRKSLCRRTKTTRHASPRTSQAYLCGTVSNKNSENVIFKTSPNHRDIEPLRNNRTIHNDKTDQTLNDKEMHVEAITSMNFVTIL